MDLVQNQKWAFILAGEKFINKVYQKTKQTPKLSGNRERRLTDAATKDKGRAWVHTRKKLGGQSFSVCGSKPRERFTTLASFSWLCGVFEKLIYR